MDETLVEIPKVKILLSQHIGAPAKAIVKVGDQVTRGQMIAEPAQGFTAADAMVKTSDVEIVEAQTVCPGKYIAIITGDLSAVKAAVDTAVTTYEDKCIDSFVLGNPHESLFPAIYGTTQVEEISALGILETYDAASIIEAADQAAKTAIVDLIELRIAKGMCGKSYMMITGEVSAVSASIDRAKELVAAKGMYLDSSVIAHPDRKMIDSLL